MGTILDKSWEIHATRINAAYHCATESFLETGRLLIAAKEGPDKLPHGQFKSMVKFKLSFGPDTAQKLMKIARHTVLSNAAHVRLLPPSYATLYELTKVNNAVLIARLADGTINPTMERKDVAVLRRADEAETSTTTTQPAETSDTKNRRQPAHKKCEAKRVEPSFASRVRTVAEQINQPAPAAIKTDTKPAEQLSAFAAEGAKPNATVTEDTIAEPVSLEETLAKEFRNIIRSALSKSRRAGTVCDREILAATSRIICAMRGKLNEPKFESYDIEVRLTKRAPASPAVARLGELGGSAA